MLGGVGEDGEEVEQVEQQVSRRSWEKADQGAVLCNGLGQRQIALCSPSVSSK